MAPASSRPSTRLSATATLGRCTLEEAKPDKPKLSPWMLPWRVVRFFGRLAAGCFVAVGVFVVLAIVGYVQFEEIVEAIDCRYSAEIDDHLGIDKATIARLRDPAYFAQQSVLVTEDQKTVA